MGVFAVAAGGDVAEKFEEGAPTIADRQRQAGGVEEEVLVFGVEEGWGAFAPITQVPAETGAACQIVGHRKPHDGVKTVGGEAVFPHGQAGCGDQREGRGLAVAFAQAQLEAELGIPEAFVVTPAERGVGVLLQEAGKAETQLETFREAPTHQGAGQLRRLFDQRVAFVAFEQGPGFDLDHTPADDGGRLGLVRAVGDQLGFCRLERHRAGDQKEGEAAGEGSKRLAGAIEVHGGLRFWLLKIFSIMPRVVPFVKFRRRFDGRPMVCIE